MSNDPTHDRPRLQLFGGASTGPTDRATRAQALADDFARLFPPTLPPPGSEVVPSVGRHVRCTAETPGQIYLCGQTYPRDARARITVRSSGMPGGWCLRLTLVESAVVAVTPSMSGSRADPAVLRAQRHMADPASAAALAAPLRTWLPGRPVHNELHSLFVPGGMAFLREVSVVVPVGPDPAEDGELATQLAAVARAALLRDAAGPSRTRPVGAPRRESDDGTAGLRRGHLRVIQ